MKTKAKVNTRLAMSLLCLALCPLAQAQTQTQAQTGSKEALYAASLAATCANCHGTNGKAVEGSSITSLAGLDKSYIAGQMRAFKTGTRPATLMHQISKGYSEAQIESMASYFSAQKK